jgi:hypothetical protein
LTPFSKYNSQPRNTKPVDLFLFSAYINSGASARYILDILSLFNSSLLPTFTHLSLICHPGRFKLAIAPTLHTVPKTDDIQLAEFLDQILLSEIRRDRNDDTL